MSRMLFCALTSAGARLNTVAVVGLGEASVPPGPFGTGTVNLVYALVGTAMFVWPIWFSTPRLEHDARKRPRRIGPLASCVPNRDAAFMPERINSAAAVS